MRLRALAVIGLLNEGWYVKFRLDNELSHGSLGSGMSPKTLQSTLCL